LLEDPDCFYHYDDEGNLIFREFKRLQETGVRYDRKRMEKERGIRCLATETGWLYEWASNGMLRRVVRPDGRPVEFRYDALGRRTAKQYFGKITRWVWDGNVPIHEWSYKAIGLQSDEAGILPKEPVEDITTWVFEAGTFVPTAKIQESKQYSIVSDYLGTPIQMYDGQGNKTWDCTLDIYGKVIAVDKGTEFDCPFRFQGQYADEETGLFYNRFRYYSLNINSYINQDFIRIYGGYHIYNYVHDTNKYIDIFGLSRKKYSYLIGANGTILGENISQDTDINSLNHQFKEIVIKAKSEVTNPKPYHGKCAEINAIQKALDNGYSLDDIKGATMRTVKMFEGKSTNELVPACECCKIVMKELGIKEEYGKIEECH
ncbi:RHS repeat-associated core domain-containing protein, partial [Phocaeicola vulgatus]